MRSWKIVAGLVSLAGIVQGLGQKQLVHLGKKLGGDVFTLAGKSVGVGQILVSSDDYWGVIRAAGDLAADFGRVTGSNYTLSNGVKGAKPASFDFEPVNNKNNTVVSFDPYRL